MCVVSALGATLRASGQRSPRASGAPHALPDSSCVADRSGDRTLRFSFGKFITCADVKTLRAVNGTCFISNQGSLAFSDFTMESSVLLLLITVSKLTPHGPPGETLLWMQQTHVTFPSLA